MGPDIISKMTDLGCAQLNRLMHGIDHNKIITKAMHFCEFEFHLYWILDLLRIIRLEFALKISSVWI